MRSIAMMFVAALACATPAAAQSPARAMTPTPAPPPQEMKGQPAPQGFSVVLVLGDLNGSASADANVPPAARKALNDMKDFLPYKGYRLLDAEWILGSRRATTRLRGPDGQDYELTLTSMPAMSQGGQKQRIMFQLRDALGDAEPMAMASGRAGSRAAMEKQVRDLESEIAALRARQSEATALRTREGQLAELKARLDSGDAMVYTLAPFGHRSVIDTSFDMDIGETVVVGTSRLKDSGKDSGRALIALLTAVPKNGSSAKQD